MGIYNKRLRDTNNTKIKMGRLKQKHFFEETFLALYGIFVVCVMQGGICAKELKLKLRYSTKKLGQEIFLIEPPCPKAKQL